jgi:hypothetical protein
MIANNPNLEVETLRDEKVRRSSNPTTSYEKVNAQSTAGNLDTALSM